MTWRSAIGPLVGLAFWALLTYSGAVKPLFLPPPHAVAASLYELLAHGALLADLTATFARTLAAFLLSVFAGIIIGVPLGLWKRLYEACEVVFDFFRSMPSPALIPIAMLILGLGDSSRIAVAAFTCSLINAIQASYAVKSIPSQRVAAARLAGAQGGFLFWRVLFPSALPTLVAGWRITLSLSLIIVVVTEMFIGTQTGLGMRILDLHLMFRIADMYAAIVLVGSLGYALNKLVEVTEARIVHWRTWS